MANRKCLFLPPAYSPPMENHILSSGNNGTLEYKASLAPISPGRYSPIPKHMLVEDDYTRSDVFLCYISWQLQRTLLKHW